MRKRGESSHGPAHQFEQRAQVPSLLEACAGPSRGYGDHDTQYVIDNIPAMIWTIRPDGAVDFVNRFWLDYTGLSLEEELKEPTCTIFAEDLPRVMDKWRATMAAGESFEDEMRLRRADGEYRWFLVRTVPLHDEWRRIVKWYGSSVEIDGRKPAHAWTREELARQTEGVQQRLRTAFEFQTIIGQSRALQDVLKQVDTVAPADCTVLVLGETGTGKELIARAIHDRSLRRNEAFTKIDCSAIPDALFESELFGHEKGAFTGAIAQKLGRFEVADKGILFLDEIGNIPVEFQAKLLRVLQDHACERLGSNRTQQFDVRVIAATNRDLLDMVGKGEFRADLYYRLKVFPITIPPLRERRDDIPPLVWHYVRKYAQRMRKAIDTVPASAMEVLSRYPWPGNVRELQHFIERAVVLTPGNVLEAPLRELEQVISIRRTRSASLAPTRTMEEVEHEVILQALRDSNWVVGGPLGAAAKLGLRRTTLASRMERLGISRPR